MASKRNAPKFEFKQPKSKFQKLDITQTSSQILNPITINVAKDSSKSINNEDNCIWDDDDEFILLASQAAEKVNAMKEGIGTIDSFTQFTRHADAITSSSSTQRKTDSVISNFLDDNDDDLVLSQIPTFETNFVSPAKKNNEILIKNKMIDKPENNLPLTSIPSTSKNAQNQYSSNLQNNIDRKETVCIKFMEKDLEKKKICIESLQEKIKISNELIQTKDGETKILRYELQLIKKRNDDLRREKFEEIERIKCENLNKIKNLELELNAQKTELEFKVKSLILLFLWDRFY